MREKLIELVGQVQDCGCDVTDVVEMNYVENDVLVDHLIANGVTVQECGNWKYYHKQNKAVCTSCSFERDLDANFGKAIACPNCGAYIPPNRRKENDYGYDDSV